ncbi:hypothetical protein BH11CYA1_BH11CYA1_39750 [soil metagenome]
MSGNSGTPGASLIYTKSDMPAEDNLRLIHFLLLPVCMLTHCGASSFISADAQPLQGNVFSVDLDAKKTTIPNFTELPAVTGKAHSERVDPLVFRAWLAKAHPQLLSGQVSALSPVVEVAGQWDKADKTLTKLEIPFKHIKSRDISSELLATSKVLIINCAGELKRDKLQAVRDFVSQGGYLLTTDWALDNMLVQTFPGYVSWNKGVNSKDIYDADYLAPDPVLANNTVRSAFWKLDQASHMVRILKPATVRVLVGSRQLAAEDPDHIGALAVIFPFGKGYVLHMVGHFDNNAKIAIGNFLPDPAPSIGISLRQAIATNFIVAGLEGKRLPY